MYTENTIYRAGKIVGPLGKALDDMFLLANGCTDPSTGYSKRVSFEADIKRFCHQFQENHLFDEMPGRKHKAFPEIDRSLFTKIPRPAAFKARLLQYTKKLADLRAVSGDK